MASYTDSKNRKISLIKEIAPPSGEGTVWKTDQAGLLAKIYHQSTQEQISKLPERIAKLQAMISSPPDDPTAVQNHNSLAWPQELIKDSQGNCVGFLMPEIKDGRQLIKVYHPKHRNKDASKFNWYVLHITALNLAKAIEAIHAKNYVVGDMNPRNILVNQKGLVSIIDTDSFQVTDSKNATVYLCPVGAEGFTPRELLGTDIAARAQTRYNDHFRLAVVIYHLLFGYHPFSGKWNGVGDQPGQDESVSKGYWPYSQNSQLTLAKYQIPLDVVHPKIQECFRKCFNDGHESTIQRPSPQNWIDAIEIAINELKSCNTIGNHIYSQHARQCYWCKRANILSYDAFPDVQNPIPPKPIRVIKPPVTTYLKLCNKTSSRSIKAAYAYWDGTSWKSKGWFVIDPGKSVQIDLGIYQNAVYIYGMHNNFGITWGTGQYAFWVDPINAFNIDRSDQDSSGNNTLRKLFALKVEERCVDALADLIGRLGLCPQ